MARIKPESRDRTHPCISIAHLHFIYTEGTIRDHGETVLKPGHKIWMIQVGPEEFRLCSPGDFHPDLDESVFCCRYRQTPRSEHIRILPCDLCLQNTAGYGKTRQTVNGHPSFGIAGSLKLPGIEDILGRNRRG